MKNAAERTGKLFAYSCPYPHPPLLNSCVFASFNWLYFASWKSWGRCEHITSYPLLLLTCTPARTEDRFLFISVVRQISSSHVLCIQPSTPVLDLSTLELDVGTSIRLEKNQIKGCSNKEKENIAVPPQRCTIDREQLTACRGFHLPSKCSLSCLSSLLLSYKTETSWGLTALGYIYLGI